VRDSVEHAEAVTRQVEDLVASMQSAMAPVRRAAARIDEVAERAMRASHAVLDEVEPPLRNTLAVLAGLRTGTRSLIGSLSRRANHMQSNGGNDHGGGEMPAGRDAWGEMQGSPSLRFSRCSTKRGAIGYRAESSNCWMSTGDCSRCWRSGL
jgi:hypothetical protein